MISQWNPYAAGKKHYGGGRGAPNVGKSTDMVGYGERDKKRAVQMAALKRRAG